MLSIGSQVAGYRIDGVLGRGGMGVVYEATQLSLNRKVALKLIVPEFGGEASHRERFRREALRQAAIDHPHIVTVHEAGETDEGLYFAMRLVRGPNLKDMIIGRELDAGRSLRILTAVADALDTAHGAGMIHRDLKPQNVLVGSRDHAYLADFGLTKALGDQSLTRSGQFVGTLDYVAPEQIRGEPASPASDIYSLTAVLYECLTGVVPYPRESEAAVLYGHLSLPPPKVSEQRPDLPRALDAVIQGGMAKEPNSRFPSATGLLAEANESFSRRLRAAMTPPGPIESPEETGIREPEAQVQTAPSPTRETPPPRRTDPEAPTPVVDEATPLPPPLGATRPPQRDTPQRPTPSRGLGRSLGMPLVVVAALVAVAGYLAGSSGGEAKSPSGRTVAAGPLRLKVPNDWRPTLATPNVPGLDLSRAASFAPGGSGAGTTLVTGTTTGEGPTLLPSSFLERLPRRPSPDDRVKLGPLEAIRYRDLRPKGLGGRLTVFVVPMTDAVATVACLSPGDSRTASACERVAATSRLEGESALPLGGRPAYAKALDKALERLADRRSSGRKRLNDAEEPAGQESSARALAVAYRDAAGALRRAPDGPAERPAEAALVRGSRRVAGAYARLAAAASEDDRGAYGEAAKAIGRAERAFARDLAALRRVGYSPG